MSVTSPIPADASTPQQIRKAFGQAAYMGLFPRAKWIDAQRLCAHYDDAMTAAERYGVSVDMLDFAGSVATAAPADAQIRIAA